MQNFIQISWDLAVRGPKTCFGVKKENGQAWPSITHLREGRIFQRQHLISWKISRPWNRELGWSLVMSCLTARGPPCSIRTNTMPTFTVVLHNMPNTCNICRSFVVSYFIDFLSPNLQHWITPAEFGIVKFKENWNSINSDKITINFNNLIKTAFTVTIGSKHFRICRIFITSL